MSDGRNGSEAAAAAPAQSRSTLRLPSCAAVTPWAARPRGYVSDRPGEGPEARRHWQITVFSGAHSVAGPPTAVARHTDDMGYPIPRVESQVAGPGVSASEPQVAPTDRQEASVQEERRSRCNSASSCR